jgi:hypothetical protein
MSLLFLGKLNYAFSKGNRLIRLPKQGVKLRVGNLTLPTPEGWGFLGYPTNVVVYFPS